MGIKDIISSKLPIVGKPPVGGVTGGPLPPPQPNPANKELVEKYNKMVTNFIGIITSSEYIPQVKNLVEELTNIVLDADLTNEQVPQFWAMFGQKLAEDIAKVDPKERGKELTQNDFAPIWNLFTRQHNKQLQNIPFKLVNNYDKDNS